MSVMEGMHGHCKACCTGVSQPPTQGSMLDARFRIKPCQEDMWCMYCFGRKISRHAAGCMRRMQFL